MSEMKAKEPERLKGCPICGKAPEDGFNVLSGRFFFRCENAWHSVVTYGSTLAVAARRWNRRAR